MVEPSFKAMKSTALLLLCERTQPFTVISLLNSVLLSASMTFVLIIKRAPLSPPEGGNVDLLKSYRKTLSNDQRLKGY